LIREGEMIYKGGCAPLKLPINLFGGFTPLGLSFKLIWRLRLSLTLPFRFKVGVLFKRGFTPLGHH